MRTDRPPRACLSPPGRSCEGTSQLKPCGNLVPFHACTGDLAHGNVEQAALCSRARTWQSSRRRPSGCARRPRAPPALPGTSWPGTDLGLIEMDSLNQQRRRPGVRTPGRTFCQLSLLHDCLESERRAARARFLTPNLNLPLDIPGPAGRAPPSHWRRCRRRACSCQR